MLYKHGSATTETLPMEVLFGRKKSVPQIKILYRKASILTIVKNFHVEKQGETFFAQRVQHVTCSAKPTGK